MKRRKYKKRRLYIRYEELKRLYPDHFNKWFNDPKGELVRTTAPDTGHWSDWVMYEETPYRAVRPKAKTVALIKTKK